jgi:hypothetical protein
MRKLGLWDMKSTTLAVRHTIDSAGAAAGKEQDWRAVGKRVSGGPEGNSSEERFARQDGRRYSGWSSAVAVAAIVIVLGIVLIIYHTVH